MARPASQKPARPSTPPPASKARPASGSRLRAAKPAASPARAARGGAARVSSPPANDTRPRTGTKEPSVSSADRPRLDSDRPDERSVALLALLAGVPARADREAQALLFSLATVIGQAERTAHSHLVTVIARAVRGLIVLAANYLYRGERGELLAGSARDGSMAYLDWSWRGKPVLRAEQPAPQQTDHSDPTHDFVSDLRVLLDKHKPADGQVGEGAFCNLYEAAIFVEVMGSKHLQEPAAGHTKGLLPGLTAGYRTAPVPVSTAADETMHSIGDHLLSLHDSIREVQDGIVGARCHVDRLRGDAGPGGKWSSMGDVQASFSETDGALWHVRCDLHAAITTITGGSPTTSLPHAVSTLATLVEALGGRELNYVVDTDKARAGWLALPPASTDTKS